MDCCYSNLLDLLRLRVKTRVCSCNLYATPFFSFPSQVTLVKFIKLKRTQSVCTEKERKRERKRKKTLFSLCFFSLSLSLSLFLSFSVHTLGVLLSLMNFTKVTCEGKLKKGVTYKLQEHTRVLFSKDQVGLSNNNPHWNLGFRFLFLIINGLIDDKIYVPR